MEINNEDVKKTKAYLLETVWGRTDKIWPNFSMRSRAIKGKTDMRLVVIRSFQRHKRLIVYLLIKKNSKLICKEVYRLFQSADRYRISDSWVSGKSESFLNMKLSTGSGKNLWAQSIKGKIS